MLVVVVTGGWQTPHVHRYLTFNINAVLVLGSSKRQVSHRLGKCVNTATRRALQELIGPKIENLSEDGRCKHCVRSASSNP
jgi:hypothetical protein